MIKSFSITGIGSMPQVNPYSACEMILKYFDIPFWPQLPKYSQRELMIPQFCQGLPGIVFEEDRVFLKKDFEKITEWLTNYTEEDESALGEDFAIGIYRMAELLNNRSLDFFKGQVTGPLTFTLSLKDEEGKPVYFDETLRELCLLHLKTKIKWQINFLKKFSKNLIIFIDEPILQAVGTSTYISVELNEVRRLINELARYIGKFNALVGLHCCGRADWKEILNLDIDILSFDSFFFFDFFKIYENEILNFLQRNGYIAWGFIPTTDELKSLKDEEIISQALKKLEEISYKIPLIKEKSIITPSCGMGSLDEKDSERVCILLKNLQNRILNA